MLRARPFSSGAFRFALLIAAVFAAGSVALLFVVERAVSHYAAEAASDSVSAESDILVGEDRSLGRAELIRAISRHEHAVRERQFRYILISPDGSRLAGMLPESKTQLGWRHMVIRDADDPEQHGRPIPLLADAVRLADGSTLVVAGDLSDLVDLRHRLEQFTVAFGVLITTLALAGGLVVGGVFVRRLDGVNRAIERIVGGRFSERLPAIGIAPEFDVLTANLNRMLDRIEALMEGLRQVSTDIAHDLRTPLTRLRQRLEQMQGDGQRSPSREQVEAAVAQTDELLAIFGALLRIGALESRGNRERFAPVDLGSIAERIGDAFLPVAEDSDHQLKTQSAAGVTVVGDRELLTQAITNLVENAINHTPPGSSVILQVSSEGGVGRVSVIDDGPGIPLEERAKVLRRFYRSDRSRATPGAGLGLALVAAVAGLHDADLMLSDNSPGLRATLSLRLVQA